jgi:CDP-glycerol glycerophosphotransferase (TagB/SpsB family)/glycosyltransferase involved in cell wall biosynthesis
VIEMQEDFYMNDLISVIVPMYNTEVYLEKTLQSIVNQSYPNVEIILINDASTDRTGEIAESYAAVYKNIRLVNQQINRGVSAARNLGLNIANGDFIIFVDSDDLLTKQALEVMHSTARKNAADLVIGVYKNFTPERTRLGSMYRQFKSLTQKGEVFTFTNPEIFSHIYIFGKLYKRELIEGVSFPEHISYAEDQPFSLYTYLHAKKIHIAPSVVYYYRERDQGDSATQLALKNPLKNLQSVFDSFEIGCQYFGDIYRKNNNYALFLYMSRLVQGSIRFLFEGSVMLNNQSIIQDFLTMLKNWIETLDEYLVAATDSFQEVFFENGQIYMKYFDIETQKLYIEILRLIKDKKIEGSLRDKQETIIKNGIIEMFLNSIDEILWTNKVVNDKNYSVCYPNVSSYDEQLGQAIIHFQLIDEKGTFLLKIPLFKENNIWNVSKPVLEKENLMLSPKTIQRKPRILLTYRDFSGCNTFALYKSIPSYINDCFEVDFVSGNRMSIDYVRKVMESDIIITTNMEYGFNKFDFDPNKIVVDLWHGFPLKNMFFEDPYYHDKSSITPYWSQFNYLLSYSDLYSEVVNKCVKVNPNNFFITGAPRNDLLFTQNQNSRGELFDLMGKEDNGQKIIVYMPTFRHSDQKKDFDCLNNIFGFEEFDFDEFTMFLEENHFELIIKSHPIFARDFEGVYENDSCITFIDSNDLMNNYIDFYEVLGASDLLITDYSSVYFDYLLLDKPIIFMPTDLEEYQVERGFVLGAYEEWTPGPKVINQIELQSEILEYEKNIVEYRNIRNHIKNKVHFYQDSNSTERVWEFISTLGTNLIKAGT